MLLVEVARGGVCENARIRLPFTGRLLRYSRGSGIVREGLFQLFGHYEKAGSLGS